MQINELLLKNFGKFHDRQINLEEGINLIHGENESGKSTIHTFIKGMLFGIERGRGRAAQNDTFSIYEPWDNPNYYSGTLKFASGGKHFRIERNFDKYSKNSHNVVFPTAGGAAINTMIRSFFSFCNCCNCFNKGRKTFWIVSSL